MFGAIVVDPASGPNRNVHELFQVLSSLDGNFLINGKSFPSTDAYTARRGSKLLIRTINMDTMMNHPMHLHGISFREVGINGGVVPRRLQYPVSEQDIAPGESYDMLLTASLKGVWLFHCHNLSHVTGPGGTDAGMITVLKVL